MQSKIEKKLQSTQKVDIKIQYSDGISSHNTDLGNQIPMFHYRPIDEAIQSLITQLENTKNDNPKNPIPQLDKINCQLIELQELMLLTASEAHSVNRISKINFKYENLRNRILSVIKILY